jgi:hypothetical protein
MVGDQSAYHTVKIPKYFKHYETEPICGLSISFSFDNLRSNILGCSTDAVSYLIFRNTNFGQSEICQFYVSLGIKKNIFRFQVSVNDVSGVQILEGKKDLSGIELSYLFWELSVSPKEIE